MCVSHGRAEAGADESWRSMRRGIFALFEPLVVTYLVLDEKLDTLDRSGSGLGDSGGDTTHYVLCQLLYPASLKVAVQALITARCYCFESRCSRRRRQGGPYSRNQSRMGACPSPPAFPVAKMPLCVVEWSC